VAEDFLNGIRLLSLILIPLIVMGYIWASVKMAQIYNDPITFVWLNSILIAALLVVVGMGRVWKRFLE
jgi:hypothetical protein